MRPRFEHGAEVRVIRTVRNDGTYPGEPTGALLVRRGSTGFVRDMGTFLQDQIIYTVHFLEADRMVGCREEELQPAAEPWVVSRFESRDKVVAKLPLGSGGRVLVAEGAVGEVIKVLRGPARADGSGDVAYHVQFPGCNTLQVPESALAEVVSPNQDDSCATPNHPQPQPPPWNSCIICCGPRPSGSNAISRPWTRSSGPRPRPSRDAVWHWRNGSWPRLRPSMS
jgi:nitrogen fixation protein NifZ